MARAAVAAAPERGEIWQLAALHSGCLGSRGAREPSRGFRALPALARAPLAVPSPAGRAGFQSRHRRAPGGSWRPRYPCPGLGAAGAGQAGKAGRGRRVGPRIRSGQARPRRPEGSACPLKAPTPLVARGLRGAAPDVAQEGGDLSAPAPSRADGLLALRGASALPGVFASSRPRVDRLFEARFFATFPGFSASAPAVEVL